MKRRDTVRVLLLDPSRRVLLMRGRVLTSSDQARFWFTVGGGLRPGEAVEAAARREILEETGFDDVRIGPIVWRREAVVPDMETGESLLNRESYVVACCAGAPPDRSGWDAAERRAVDDIRWWSLNDIETSAETIYPKQLAQLLRNILEGGPHGDHG